MFPFMSYHMGLPSAGLTPAHAGILLEPNGLPTHKLLAGRSSPGFRRESISFLMKLILKLVIHLNSPSRFTVFRPISQPLFSKDPIFSAILENPEVFGNGRFSNRSLVVRTK